jgi:hypothetical protein
LTLSDLERRRCTPTPAVTWGYPHSKLKVGKDSSDVTYKCKGRANTGI